MRIMSLNWPSLQETVVELWSILRGHMKLSQKCTFGQNREDTFTYQLLSPLVKGYPEELTSLYSQPVHEQMPSPEKDLHKAT